jgi:hypothetical protein
MNARDKSRLAKFRQQCCKYKLDGDPKSTSSPAPIPKVDDIPTSDDPKIDGDDRTDPFDLGPKPTNDPPPPTIIPPTAEPPPTMTLQEEFPFPKLVPGPTFLGTPPIPKDTDVPPNIDPNPIDDPSPPMPPPIPPPPPTTQCPSMHPDYTSVVGGKSQAQQVRDITAAVNAKGFRHDPDGIPWIPRSSWVPWDGVTTINPCTSTTAQLMAFIFPKPGGVHTMRGLRERFYEVNPFKDNSNPTVAEIEDWNIETIRHFRRLLGFNQTTHPVYNNKCMYLRAAWSDERARSNYWTSNGYPSGTLDGSTGPCTVPFSSNAHCGGGFILNAADQTPYLCPPTMAPCTASGGAEGIQNINTDIPWGIKMSRIIGSFLNSDGIGAHTGPFIGREYFGSSWYVNGGTTIFRGKWTGKLAPTCP